MNVQTGLTWKTFIVALNYPCLMHPHLRFSNFPHKSTYTCHYVYMYFAVLFVRREKFCAFWGDESLATNEKMYVMATFMAISSIVVRRTQIWKNEFDVVIIAIFMPTHPSLVVQDLTSILKTLFDLNVSRQNVISWNL